MFGCSHIFILIHYLFFPIQPGLLFDQNIFISLLVKSFKNSIRNFPTILLPRYLNSSYRIILIIVIVIWFIQNIDLQQKDPIIRGFVRLGWGCVIGASLGRSIRFGWGGAVRGRYGRGGMSHPFPSLTCSLHHVSQYELLCFASKLDLWILWKVIHTLHLLHFLIPKFQGNRKN